MQPDGKCSILRTSSRVTFRKRNVLFGVKGKCMIISGYTIQKKQRVSSSAGKLFVLFVHVFCLRENRKVRTKERNKRGRREEPAREQKAGCCGGQGSTKTAQ